MNQEQPKLAPDQEMLALLRKREEREAREFEQKELQRLEAEENLALRKQRRADGDRQMWDAAMAWQSRCDHRKGTSGKKKWRHIDYDIGRHTFQNGLTVVKCFKCRFRSFPGDTREQCSYTDANFKNGVKVPNPTKLSYKDWYTMTLDENTTNTETRSEMVTQGPQPVTA